MRETGVLVYLDPPYYRVYDKNGYYKGHTEFDFTKFKEDLIGTKHRFIMTIDITEYSESLKEHFNVIEYDIYYSMSRKWTKEYIIKNY